MRFLKHIPLIYLGTLLFSGLLSGSPPNKILFELTLHTDSLATISGYVEDAQTGERLIGANVYAKSQQRGSITNEYGFYSLTLSRGTIELVFSYLGYSRQVREFALEANVRLDIALEPAFQELDEIEVNAGQLQDENTLLGVVEVPISTLQAVPVLMGEPDILKALQLLPGIQTGTEGTAGLYVRGGGPDQNLVLLDGVPVYNPDHLFGFFSVFNADAIKNVSLIKGGFPARYGGRLASVVDVSMKEGNTKSLSGQANVGLISSRVLLEGPLPGDRASFMFAGRRTYLDLLILPFLSKGERRGYFFYDYNAKVNFKLSPRNQLFVSNYAGRDRLLNRSARASEETRSVSDEGLLWGNQTATVRWSSILSSKLFFKALFGYTRYTVQLYNGEEQYTSDDSQQFISAEKVTYSSGIRDWSGRIEVDFMPSVSHTLKAGVLGTLHKFEPVTLREDVREGPISILDTLYVSSGIIDGTELSAYLEDDISVGRVGINVGLHASSFGVQNRKYYALQPRLSLKIGLLNQIVLKASYSQAAQYIHLLASNGIGLPTNLWVPATSNIKPQRGSQWSIGVSKKEQSGYLTSIELFYRPMRGQIEFRDGASFFDLTDQGGAWEQFIVSGEGEAYGAEFLIQKTAGKTSGWLGYSLTWSNRTFPELNNGVTFPFTYDRRHDVALVLLHKLKDHVNLALNWVLNSGRPLWLPEAQFQGFVHNPGAGQTSPQEGQAPENPLKSIGVLYYGPRNASRAETYHRLDLSAQFLKVNKLGERQLTIGVYNAYRRKNPSFIWPDSGDGRVVLKQVSIFPIVPSISYQQFFR